MMGVTVVIPTLERGEFLLNTLRDLLAQDYRPMEILVVDQSAVQDPQLVELACGNPDTIRLHHVGFRGLPMARNFGWQHAKHPIVLYLDDDIRCPPELVSEHVQALTSHELSQGVGVVGGAVIEPHRVSKPVSKGSRGMTFNYWTATPVDSGMDQDTTTEASHAKGGNFSMWKSVLEKVGGFDETFGIGAALHEETEFCLRVRKAGYRILFHGPARLTHLAAPSGGCRVPDLPRYIWSLAHNRGVIIRRHLKWYQRPTASLRLGLLVLSYARSSRQLSLIRAGLRGLIEGLGRGRANPVCTKYPNPGVVQAL